VLIVGFVAIGIKRPPILVREMAEWQTCAIFIDSSVSITDTGVGARRQVTRLSGNGTVRLRNRAIYTCVRMLNGPRITAINCHFFEARSGCSVRSTLDISWNL
jgi:hypothetical protein